MLINHPLTRKISVGEVGIFRNFIFQPTDIKFLKFLYTSFYNVICKCDHMIHMLYVRCLSHIGINYHQMSPHLKWKWIFKKKQNEFSVNTCALNWNMLFVLTSTWIKNDTVWMPVNACFEHVWFQMDQYPHVRDTVF